MDNLASSHNAPLTAAFAVRRIAANIVKLPEPHWVASVGMQLRPGPLMPANKSLHFLESYGAVVIGIHGLEDALVRRLKLLQ